MFGSFTTLARSLIEKVSRPRNIPKPPTSWYLLLSWPNRIMVGEDANGQPQHAEGSERTREHSRTGGRTWWADQSRDLPSCASAQDDGRQSAAWRRSAPGSGTGDDVPVGTRSPAPDRPHPPGRLRRSHHDQNDPAPRAGRVRPALPRRR